MLDILHRLQRLLHNLADRQEFYWLLLLILILIAVRQIPQFLPRSKRKPPPPSPLDVDVQALPQPVIDSDEPTLRVYHIPVHVGLVVIAPLGRDTDPPSPNTVPELLEKTVPGLGAVVEHGKPRLRVWPTQLSASGFVHSLIRHLKLPGKTAKDSAWCVVAGRMETASRQFMIGLALCAAEPNNLSIIEIESDHQWLDVLRIPE